MALISSTNAAYSSRNLPLTPLPNKPSMMREQASPCIRAGMGGYCCWGRFCNFSYWRRVSGENSSGGHTAHTCTRQSKRAANPMASPALLPLPAYTVMRSILRAVNSGSFCRVYHRRSITASINSSDVVRPSAKHACSAARITAQGCTFTVLVLLFLATLLHHHVTAVILYKISFGVKPTSCTSGQTH